MSLTRFLNTPCLYYFRQYCPITCNVFLWLVWSQYQDPCALSHTKLFTSSITMLFNNTFIVIIGAMKEKLKSRCIFHLMIHIHQTVYRKQQVSSGTGALFYSLCVHTEHSGSACVSNGTLIQAATHACLTAGFYSERELTLELLNWNLKM